MNAATAARAPFIVAPDAFAANAGSFASVNQIPILQIALTDTTPAPTPPAPTPEPPVAQSQGYVWADSNFVTSGGNVRTVVLTGLNPGATELQGRLVHIKGQTPLNGDFMQKPFSGELVPLPGDKGFKTTVTRDGFDQVVAYHAITSLITYLGGRGVNMEKMLSSRLPIVAAINAVPDLNAWFDPSKRNGIDITTGTAKDSPMGEWHLGSDMEILWHELGHLMLHCINPALTSWYARDGGAIHEGFGDGNACFRNLDPEASEDFAMNLSREYGTNRGLRTVDNNLQYGKVDREVHSLGRVYGAFWWSTMKALLPTVGNDERLAGDLAWMIMLEHGYQYATNRPGPGDFLNATKLGADTLIGKHDDFKGLNAELVKGILQKSAEARGMVNNGHAVAGRWERSLRGLTEYTAHLANRYEFIAQATSWGTFTGRQFEQQFAIVNGAYIRMLGAGLLYQRSPDDEDRITRYSKSDARTDVDVNPEIKVAPQQALQAVLVEAQRLAEEKRRKQEELERDGKLGTRESWRVQAEARKYEEALQAATAGMADPSKLQVEIVVMPDGYEHSPEENLHYQFALGGTAFYVDARTGNVAAMEMPDW